MTYAVCRWCNTIVNTHNARPNENGVYCGLMCSINDMRFDMLFSDKNIKTGDVQTLLKCRTNKKAP